MNLDIYVYYIHFEITGDPCNLICIQQRDLFPNRTIFRALDLIIFRSMMSKKISANSSVTKVTEPKRNFESSIFCRCHCPNSGSLILGAHIVHT